LLYCKVIQPTADTYATRRQARLNRPTNTLMLCFLTAHLAAARNNRYRRLHNMVMKTELNMPSTAPAATYPSIRFEPKSSDTIDSENLSYFDVKSTKRKQKEKTVGKVSGEHRTI
jgi:hypothetical protein